MSTSLIPAVVPVSRRVRAYFAPVNRATETPTLFDPAQMGSFALGMPPAPWVDLGWCTRFVRKSGTKISPLRTGVPAMPSVQVRTEAEATVQVEFESWGKLQMSLTCGSQQMNLLGTATGAALNGSGGAAAAPVALAAGSTSTTLNVGTMSANFAVGGLVAVDLDYTGQTGFVGSGVSAAYVSAPTRVANDRNYVRRVTLNVGRITSIANGVLTFGSPLLAGAPTAGMQVCSLTGFVDREGSTFFQEWSALFVMEGEQGDRVIFHYPRLQSMQGVTETVETLAAPLEGIRLTGAFRALPVVDVNDGEIVLCFRSYLPAAMRAV